MINVIWIGLILISILLGVINGTTTQVVASVTTSCKTAIDITISLVGVMTLWLGLMPPRLAYGPWKIFKNSTRCRRWRPMPCVPF